MYMLSSNNEAFIFEKDHQNFKPKLSPQHSIYYDHQNLLKYNLFTEALGRNYIKIKTLLYERGVH